MLFLSLLLREFTLLTCLHNCHHHLVASCSDFILFQWLCTAIQTARGNLSKHAVEHRCAERNSERFSAQRSPPCGDLKGGPLTPRGPELPSPLPPPPCSIAESGKAMENKTSDDHSFDKHASDKFFKQTHYTAPQGALKPKALWGEMQAGLLTSVLRLKAGTCETGFLLRIRQSTPCGRRE